MVFGGRPFSVIAGGALVVSPDLDAIEIESASLRFPERGLVVGGKGRLAGRNPAFTPWYDSIAKSRDVLQAAPASLTALEDIRLEGSMEFDSPKETEIAGGAFMQGAIRAKGKIVRGKDPYGRMTARMEYDDFS